MYSPTIWKNNTFNNFLKFKIKKKQQNYMFNHYHLKQHHDLQILYFEVSIPLNFLLYDIYF